MNPNRFGGCRAPEQIEMVSGDGAPYMARAIRIFARQINLKPCFAPVASPQSNDISEAFVRTMKRDHIRTNPSPNAERALKLVVGWFEDYYDNHPHFGLKMRSPREFIQAQTATT